MKTLNVHFHGLPVGELCQTQEGRIEFSYSAEWIDKQGAPALSQSLPLRAEKFSERECIGFFGGLLPEEYNREIDSTRSVL